jgi:hypothetical protein
MKSMYFDPPFILKSSISALTRDALSKTRNSNEHDIQITQMKAQLTDLMSRSVIARGVSVKYITSNARTCFQFFFNRTVDS